MVNVKSLNRLMMNRFQFYFFIFIKNLFLFLIQRVVQYFFRIINIFQEFKVSTKIFIVNIKMIEQKIKKDLSNKLCGVEKEKNENIKKLIHNCFMIVRGVVWGVILTS